MTEKIGADVIGRKKKLRTQNKERVRAEDLQIRIRKIAECIRRNPEDIGEDTKEELRRLLVDIEKSSRQTNPDFSQKAQEWLSSIQKGVSLSADIVQLFTFLSGMTSLPMLFQATKIANNISCGSRVLSDQSPLKKKDKAPKMPKETAYV